MARGGRGSVPGRTASLPKGGGNAARSALANVNRGGTGGPGVIKSVAGGAINRANVGISAGPGKSFSPGGRGSAPAASRAAVGLKGGQPGARMGLQGKAPTQAANYYPRRVTTAPSVSLSPGRTGGRGTGGLSGRSGGSGGRGSTSGPAGALTGTTTGTNPAGTY